MKLYLVPVALLLLCGPAIAQANNVSQQVGVCDPRPSKGAACILPNADGSLNVGSDTRTIIPLDISTVTTGETAVTALIAGHKTAGGFLQNPAGASVALCINEQGTASGTTSSGNTTCIQPGQSYFLTPSSGAVSVISSDSSHPFSGQGLQ